VETVVPDASRWTWEAGAPVATEHLGRPCVALQDTTGVFADAAFEDGVVEVELAVGPERGFHGVVWRAEDDQSLEAFYVRPHQVGNPDAVQYTPFFHGVGGFQLYHGPGYWAPVEFPLDEWFTIRVVFGGARAEVYVADLEKPALAIGELKRAPAAGKVGVLTGVAPVHVARLSYAAEAPAFRVTPPESAPPVAGIVAEWSVSDPFDEQLLTNALPDELLAGRTWTTLTSDPSGLVDLARLAGNRDGANTVLARTTVTSPRVRTAELAFGFSDRVAVYLNGQLHYRGDDAYRSRDYRFLGSIGWFDRLYLPLTEGENDLILAVSEDFGGWGLQAKLA
jgi:hypothetical protein